MKFSLLRKDKKNKIEENKVLKPIACEFLIVGGIIDQWVKLVKEH